MQAASGQMNKVTSFLRVRSQVWQEVQAVMQVLSCVGVQKG
jgi:hypothetical protein